MITNDVKVLVCWTDQGLFVLPVRHTGQPLVVTSVDEAKQHPRQVCSVPFSVALEEVQRVEGDGNGCVAYRG